MTNRFQSHGEVQRLYRTELILLLTPWLCGAHRQIHKNKYKVYIGHLDTERLQAQPPTKYIGLQFACIFSLLSPSVSYRLEASTEQTQNSKLILNVVFQKMDIKLIWQQANVNPGWMLTLYSQAFSRKVWRQCIMKQGGVILGRLLDPVVFHVLDIWTNLFLWIYRLKN